MASDATAESTTAADSVRPSARAAERFPRWVVALVIVGALGVLSLTYGALFSPQTLLAAGQHMNDAVRVWARFAAAYSGSLGLALLVLLAVGARQMLVGVLVQAGLTELLLIAVGVANHRWEQVPADIVMIAIFILCARRLSGRTTVSSS